MDHQGTPISMEHGHLSPGHLMMPNEQTISQFHNGQDLYRGHASSNQSGSMNRLSPMALNDFPFTEDVPLFSLMDQIGVGIYPMN